MRTFQSNCNNKVVVSNKASPSELHVAAEKCCDVRLATIRRDDKVERLDGIIRHEKENVIVKSYQAHGIVNKLVLSHFDI